MGYTDLHCHLLPAIDDGVRTLDEGIEIARGLLGLGFTTIVATPHIKTGIYDNRRAIIEGRAREMEERLKGEGGAPQLAFAAEHFIDDAFVRIFEGGEAVPYRGGKTILVEFPHQNIPLKVENLLF